MSRFLQSGGALSRLLLVGLLFIGCNPATRQLSGLLKNGEYAAAAKQASDPTSAARLAGLLLIDQANQTPAMARSNLLAIARCQSIARPLLRQAAASGNESVRAIAKILRAGQRATRHNAILPLGSDQSDLRAVAAVRYARKLPTQIIAGHLLDPEPIVRGAVVAALCDRSISQSTADKIARILTRDPSPHVRIAAISCIQQFGASRLERLKNIARTDDNDQVKVAAIDALLSLDDTQLTHFVEQFSFGPQTPFKVMVAARLAARGNPTGVQRLLDALDTDAPVALLAARFLYAGHTYKKAARHTLFKIWKTGGANSQEALQILAVAGHPTAVNALRTAGVSLENEPPITWLRRAAQVSALRPLIWPLLGSNQESIRLAAAHATLIGCP